jgi:hypothetical protein
MNRQMEWTWMRMMSTPTLLWRRLILKFVIGVFVFCEPTHVFGMGRVIFERQITAEGRLLDAVPHHAQNLDITVFNS